MTAQTSDEKKIYQIKIVLREVKPPVWRRLLVSSDTNLYELHKIFQLAMGWSNGHLHNFIIEKKDYSIPSEDDWKPVLDEREFTLSDVAEEEGKRFLYEYDFGDDWGHDVLVEKILPVETDGVYPRCTGGKRACPPEDVGGSWGYERFLQAVKDPEHEEHESWKEWVGRDFDPEEFNLEDTDDIVRDYVKMTAWWDDYLEDLF